MVDLSAPGVEARNPVDLPVTTAAFARTALVAGEERALAYVSALVARLQANADSLGAPSPLTRRQAATIERAIALASLLQTRLADIDSANSSVVPTADINTANALATQLGTIKTRLASVLANATVLWPTSKSVDPASFALAANSLDPTGHHCDATTPAPASAASARATGDHQWSGGDWSHDRYDGSRR